MNTDITGKSISERVAIAKAVGFTNAKGDKTICCECGRHLHSLAVHLSTAHKEFGPNYVDSYNEKYPGAPTQSAFNAARISAAQTGTQRRQGEAQEPPAEAVKEEQPELASALAAHHDGGTVTPIGPRVSEWMELPCGSGKARLAQWKGWASADKAMVAEYDERYEVSGDVEEQLARLALGIDMVEHVLIIGPTGSGKTSLVNLVSALSNQPVTRINFFGDMRPSDLVGDIEMVETGDGNVVTQYADGPVVTAMRRGHILLIDEIDAAPPQVHTVLQRLTERHHDPIGAIAAGKPHCTLMLPTGEEVHAHPAFRIVATANTSGSGDMSGDYAGTFVLNAAMLDRWGIKIRHLYPTEAVWIKMLIGKTGLPTDDAKVLVQAAIKVNEAKAKARCRASCSPRKTLVWGRIAKRVGGLLMAAEMTILNGIDPSDPDYKTIGDIIRQVVGR